MVKKKVIASDNALLCLNVKDNIAVTCRKLKATEVLIQNGLNICVLDEIDIGHKINLKFIGTGDKIIKYGVVIGSALFDIPAGSHIHTHNIQSDYIASYSRSGLIDNTKG